MAEYIQEISFEQAKKIAEEMAYQRLHKYRTKLETPLLQEKYSEAECCWFFFRNREIFGPDEDKLGWDCAYAISKKGDKGIIVDFSDDPEKLEDYLQKMSNRNKERNL